MADFSPLLKRAIAALPLNTVAARRDIYERARSALVKQLRNLDPPIEESLIDKELLQLESSIEAIEAEQVEKASGAMENELAEALKADLAPKPAEPKPIEAKPPEARPVAPEPVAVNGEKEVHDAAIDASRLGAAVSEAKKSAEDVLQAVEPPLSPPPLSPPVRAIAGEPLNQPALEVPNFDGERIVMVEPGRSRDRESSGRGVKVAVGALALVLVVAGGLFAYMQVNGRPARTATPSVATAPAERPVGKAEDRVQQDSPASTPPGTTSQPAPPPVRDVTPAAPQAAAPSPAPAPAVSRPPPATAQRAVLLEEVPGQQQGLPLAGTIVWRTETVNGTNGQPELALRGDIEVPERRFGVTLIIRPNTDNTLPASHTIEILFRLPRDFPFGGVANVPGLLAKQSEQSRGQPLVGQAVRVTSSFFLIGLSSEPTDVTQNIAHLRERAFFDLPIMYDNGRRAILTVEKGENGVKAFNDAFAAWKQ